MNSIEKTDFSSFLVCNILPVYSSYVTVLVNVYGQLLVFLSDLAVVYTLLYWQIEMMIMMTAMTYKRNCSYVATSCMHPVVKVRGARGAQPPCFDLAPPPARI